MDGLIHCICDLPFDDGFSVKCDGCNCRSHGCCYAITLTSLRPKVWKCALCEPARYPEFDNKYKETRRQILSTASSSRQEDSVAGDSLKTYIAVAPTGSETFLSCTGGGHANRLRPIDSSQKDITWLSLLDQYRSQYYDLYEYDRLFTALLPVQQDPTNLRVTQTILKELSSTDHADLIDLFHEILRFKNDFKNRRRIDNILIRIVKETGLLPSSLIINNVKKTGKGLVAGGGFGDIWRGMQGNIDVAMKVLRIFGIFEEREYSGKILRAFCSEVLVWHRLRHNNIMPFYGICVSEFAPLYALISPWMKNGTLLDYLRKQPSSDRRALMSGVASGVEYLHSLKPAVVHGDLRASNVLIGDDGQPKISDFGLATFIDSQAPDHSSKKGASWRWCAPELLSPSLSPGIAQGLSISSDVYAFACVCLEIFTEKAPFSDIYNDAQVVCAVVVENKQPSRPPQPAADRGLSDDVWSLMQDCWAVQPHARPNMTAVLARLRETKNISRYLIALLHEIMQQGDLLEDRGRIETFLSVLFQQDVIDRFNNTIFTKLDLTECTGLIDLLHEILQYEDKLQSHLQVDRLLVRIVKRTGLLPSSLIVNNVKRTGERPVASVAFMDVWRGMQGTADIAMKVLRFFVNSDKRILWKLCSETLVWYRLRHNNIMPFYGICVSEFAPLYALISPWMKNGTLLDYLRKQPSSDRRALMSGVANGVEYLHSLKPAVVHGDLRASNVLIGDDGQPKISDFGLATFFYDTQVLTPSSVRGASCQWRWHAPELLGPSLSSDFAHGPSISSDVYAFACVCLEIFTENIPFSDYTDVEVIIAVVGHNKRPSRPPQPAENRGLSDEVWSLIQDCWAAQPGDRPNMSAVLSRIHYIMYGTADPKEVLEPGGNETINLGSIDSKTPKPPFAEGGGLDNVEMGISEEEGDSEYGEDGEILEW